MDSSLSRSLALFVLGLSACGGPGPAAPTMSTATVDEATSRAILAQYSPRGAAIVNAYETLPTHFEFVDGGFDVSSADTFDGYLDDHALAKLPTHLNTAVHELTHSYASREAYRQVAERKLRFGTGALAVTADGEPTLVSYTPVFPVAELERSFPADARTFKYQVYVAPSEAHSSPHDQGLYRLLDEYAAYYQGGRTLFELWPWVRDHHAGDAQVVLGYAVALDDVQRSYRELRLFVLHYLRHARDHHPEVYLALVGNRDLRQAFTAVDQAHTALVTAAAELEPAVFALGSSSGVRLDRRDGLLLIDGHPQRADEAAALQAIGRYLEDPGYREMVAALR